MKHENDDRYRLIFEDSPVALTENDCSALKSHLDRLQREGVTHVAEYFDKHPGEIRKCLQMILPLAANKATLRLFKVRSLEDLIDRFDSIFTDGSFEFFRQTLAAMSEGLTFFDGQSVNNDLEGNELHLHLSWSVCPGCEKTYSRVFISFLDITDRMRAEEALRDSQEKWRLLAENAPDVFITMSLDGTVLYLNRTGTSKPTEQVIGTSVFDYVPDEYHELMKRTYSKAIETGETQKYEVKSIRTDGSTAWYMTHVGPVKHNDQTTALMLISRDITVRKNTELALRESEVRMGHLLAGSPAILYSGGFVDETFVPTFVSSNVSEIFGFRVEECLDDKGWWWARIHPEDREKASKWLDELKKEDHYRHEYRFRLKDDSYVLIEDTLRLYRDDQGNPSSIVGMWIDITERKRAEDALRESEEMYRNLIITSPDSIVVTDLDANLMYVSQKTLELYGYDNEEEVIGTNALEYFAPEDRERARDNIRKTIEEGFIKDVEYTFLRKDGTRFTGELNASLVRDAGGDPKVFISTTRDISMRKKVADELKDSREQLRQLAAHLQSVREGERTRISREIHDELGQVLTAMKMDLAWVANKLPRDQAVLQDKIRSISNLADTTIRTVKRISSELRPGLLDDLGLVAAVEWQMQEFQERTGIDCELLIEPDEFDLDVERATTVFRILQEALTNVARHSNASQVEVLLHKKAGNIELMVRDNGEGIKKRQINSPESLGLTGMRERCYSIGGEIRINGKRGQGTMVEVFIPFPHGSV